MLNGFMIFLMATFWFVSWSRAELGGQKLANLSGPVTPFPDAYQTRPNAPMPTGWRSEYLFHASTQGALSASYRDGATSLEVISNVVPKIWARMNSAILAVYPDQGCLSALVSTTRELGVYDTQVAGRGNGRPLWYLASRSWWEGVRVPPAIRSAAPGSAACRGLPATR